MKNNKTSNKTLATVTPPAPVEIIRPTETLVSEAYNRFTMDKNGFVVVRDKNVTARDFAVVVCDQLAKAEHAGIAATSTLRAAGLVSDEMEKNVKAILAANLSEASYRNIVGNLAVLQFRCDNPVFASLGLNTLKDAMQGFKKKDGEMPIDAKGKLLESKLPPVGKLLVAEAKAGKLTTAKVREIRKAAPATGKRKNASGKKDSGKTVALPSQAGAELTAEAKALTLVTQWSAVKQTASLLDGETKAKLVAMITDIARVIGGCQVIVAGSK